MAGSDGAGASLIKRAVELDSEGRYEEALTFYQTGIEQLITTLKGITDTPKRQHFRQKVTEYMARAEKLKEHVDQLKQAGKFHEQIQIEASTCGYSYRTVFGRLLDPLLTSVEIEDPYIRHGHQIHNFLRFCEMLVNSNAQVKSILLVTGQDENPDSQQFQSSKFEEISQSLKQRGIKLTVEFSPTLHDREIRFNNGWIVKIGRGLDYFKPAPSKFSLGQFDMDLRPCQETTIDIFHKQYTKTAKPD